VRNIPILVLGLFAGFLASPVVGHAVTFTTTTTLDLVDTNPGDGFCRTVEGLKCSLRAAVQEANELGGFHTIQLGPGPYKLTLRELDADDLDENLAATGDLDVTAEIVVESTSATLRDIQVASVDAAPPEDRIFHVLGGGDLTLRRVSLQDGVATSALTFRGGAILNEGSLDIADCVLDGNAAREGGAIYNAGVLDVDSSTFSNNDARTDGGGAGEGGAIFSATSGASFVLRSTLSGNGAEGIGGAIFGDPGTFLLLENSTLSGNTGPDALRLESVGQATLRHLTIYGNAGNGIVADLSGPTTLEIFSTIVAQSGADDCDFALSPTSLTSLASDVSCTFAATGGFDNADPQLGLLADNGGTTLTHLPADTSLAVDNAFSPCPLEDQRATLRPDGDGGAGACDIGAVELVPEPRLAALWLVALVATGTLARRRQ
jgi:CSLREA domain-containing protein